MTPSPRLLLKPVPEVSNLAASGLRFYAHSFPPPSHPSACAHSSRSRGNRTGSGVSVGNTSSVGSFVHSLNKHPGASQELGVILGTSLSCAKYTSILCRFSSLNNFSIHHSSRFPSLSLLWLFQHPSTWFSCIRFGLATLHPPQSPAL